MLETALKTLKCTCLISLGFITLEREGGGQSIAAISDLYTLAGSVSETFSEIEFREEGHCLQYIRSILFRWLP